MTQTTKHTPTPWEVNGDTYVTVNSLIIAHCKQHGNTTLEDAEANAAHIVKAVNCHDDLVEALDMVAKAIDQFGDAKLTFSQIQNITAALKKAGV